MTDPRIKDTKTQIEAWSFWDLSEAHDVLDGLDDAEARAQAKAERAAQARSGGGSWQR